MQENVGKVTLDYTYYPGEDLYSDGEIEDTLLEIAQTVDEDELNKVIAEKKDWAVLYHMSDVRENIVGMLPITRQDKVLEIGAGCGAITGALARKAGSVTSVDLSRKRSLVNAYRHRSYDNIRICVGNFQDIEKNLTEQYDYITLIGVFEYAQGYIGTDSPYTEFLRQIKRHLAPGGRIVIAIENRLGLKYWAGCREDHTGNLFESIENYAGGAHVRTFARPELEKLFQEVGLCDYTFYYPYPDYKLPAEIFSDEYLPNIGSLNRNYNNFDRDRLVLFDEQAAFDSLLEAGEFPLFSNSYLVVLGEKEESGAVYAKFSDDRDRRFAIRTDIVQTKDGRNVVKRALFPEGRAHLQNMAACYDALREAFMRRGVLVGEMKGLSEDAVCFDYVEAPETLESRAKHLLSQGKREEAFALVRRLAKLAEDLADRPFVWSAQFGETFGCADYPYADKSMQITDLDMVAENVLLRDSQWSLIDYEWLYAFPVPVRFVTFRIWHYFIARALPEVPQIDILLAEGFSAEEVERFRMMEEHWQSYVKGQRTPLRELYPQISPGSRNIEVELQLGRQKAEEVFRGTVYYSDSEEYAEKNALHTSLHLLPDGTFTTVLYLQHVTGRNVRWDPIEGRQCRIRITHVDAKESIVFAPINGFASEQGDEFWTLDPAYRLLGHLQGEGEVRITGKMELLYPQNELGEINQIRREKDAYFDEMERLRAQIAAMRGTKAYKGIEGLRRVRNYIMARVRAIPPFRDKQAAARKYQEWYSTKCATPQMLAAQRRTTLPDAPKISILVPTYRTPENFLRAMIDSVLAQTYPNWQLCIADASGAGEEGRITRQVLAEYAAKDARICVRYLETNGGISDNTNAAEQLAEGDYLGLLDHDDLLAPDCLFEVASAICKEQADVLYTDEGKINMEGTLHFDPNLKPDFSPDLLCSHNYITHFFVTKKSLYEEVGGLRKEYDGAQDYDLIFRCTEKAKKITHIPKILYHWRMHQASTAQNPKSKMYAYEAGKKAIEDHLRRTGLKGKVEIMDLWGLNHVTYEIPGNPLVSVIIPNKDHGKDLRRCVSSLMETSTYKNLEIIVVENNSELPETFALYEQLQKQYPQVKVVRWESTFNYSAINNFGVQQASGEYILLLNNDTKLIVPESIGEMVGLCARSDVGCVGAKLLYANNTVQHAGILLGFGPYGGFAGHAFGGLKRNAPGFMMRARITGNYCAVTAACLMVRRAVYEQVGGLDESFAVALNDVDFCLRVRKAGYVNVYTPFSLWYHYESISRGYEDTPQKQERFKHEVLHFRERWGAVVDAGDPYYNANFSMDQGPFVLW